MRTEPIANAATETNNQPLDVLSTTPGRSRFRVRGLRHNQTMKQRLERDLRHHPGITHIAVNPVTGTLLLLHHAQLTLVHIRELIKQTVHPDPDNATQGPTRNGDNNEAWHAISPRSALHTLDSLPKTGLSSTAARDRKRHYGPNELPEARQRSSWSMLKEQFTNLPVGLLTASAGLSLITRARRDAAIIMGVVALNGLIGFRTEQQAEQIISGLRQLNPQHALIRRDRKRQRVQQKDLVPGEVLLLTPGDYVAADARLLQTNGLTVDESTLTGESQPVRKRAAELAMPDTPLAERKNMVFMGTTVTGGSGVAVVIGTASHTELGSIQRLAESSSKPQTPMQRELNHIGARLAYLGGVVGVVSMGISLIHGRLTPGILRSNATLAVAAIPEGLPTVATSALALGIRRLRRQHAAVRRIDAVESLGAMTTLCLDKTGTLTANQMTVTDIMTSHGRITVDRRLREVMGQLDPDSRTVTLQLLQMAALCNDSAPGPGDDWNRLRGSATESALVKTALDGGIDVGALRRRLPLLKTRYRTEDTPFMVTIHRQPDGDALIAVKGNPSAVLARCSWHETVDGRIALNAQARARIIEQNQQMAGSGLRVLGLAFTKAPGDGDQQSASDLSWLGLIGMTDPIRADIAPLINRFHDAGIKTVMITGDQRATADAVGRQLHLGNNGRLHTMDAADLAGLSREHLKAVVRDVNVFARVSPADKLRIVRALQEADEVVAMTGDGINDGPALKAADIGIALGRSGTEAARAMADVVIEDDNLNTILTAVEGGRTIYSTIRKAIMFLLSTNFSEIQLMLAGIVLNIGRPLTTMQLLWINLITDIFPALALAMEPPEADLLQQPPRHPKSTIISADDLKTMTRASALMASASLAAYLIGRLRTNPDSANTYAFMTLTITQMLHAYSCRSETDSLFRSKRPSNPHLNLAMSASLALQLLTPLLPALRRLLGVTRVSPLDSVIIILLAIAPLLANEALKPGKGRTD